MERQIEKIGVMDSGLGGLTVVRELERILPGENIVYFGDNANCPYGNRPREEIFKLSCAMLDFMQKQGVKTVAIACNTISTLVQDLRERYEFPIVSIIEEASKYVAAEGLPQVGVFATEFTISQGSYKTLLGQLRPETKVFGIASRTLAALVDEGRFSDGETLEEVTSLLDKMKGMLCMPGHPELKHIVLGCTHYPIVQDLFEKAAPGLTFINPAAVQAEAVKAQLTGRGLLNNAQQPSLDIYTSGEKQPYEAAIKKLGIRGPLTVTVMS